MPIRTVAIISPGDMGHAVGRALQEQGLRVVTCLKGRSDRTKDLAHHAGIEDISTLEELTRQSDLILSIIPPSEAEIVAREVASALQATRSETYYADCNAISPQTARNIDAIITKGGGLFIDASIIGSPPGGREAPRLYASGSYANVMAQLDGKNIKVCIIGDKVGQASGIKMCYAALTKGSQALWIASLTAAEGLSLSKELREELRFSQSATYGRMEKAIPSVPVKARRWVGEMDEIASTFEQVGLTPYFHQAASEIFRLVGTTPFADETPENLDKNRTLDQAISVFIKYLRKR